MVTTGENATRAAVPKASPAPRCTTSSSAAAVSASSVSASTIAARQAIGSGRPLATRRAAITSRRVLTVSSRSWSVRRRSAVASCTRRCASAASTPASACTMALLHRWLGVAEGQRDEALAGAGFQALEQVLVARVVADHQHETGRRQQLLAGALDRQHAAVVGQRVQHHGGVLARLDHLVEVADGALAHRARQRAIGPDRALLADQVATHQVGRAQIVVAAHGDERALQARRHVLHEARLAAAGGPLDQHRQALARKRARTARPRPPARRRTAARACLGPAAPVRSGPCVTRLPMRWAGWWRKHATATNGIGVVVAQHVLAADEEAGEVGEQADQEDHATHNAHPVEEAPAGPAWP